MRYGKIHITIITTTMYRYCFSGECIYNDHIRPCVFIAKKLAQKHPIAINLGFDKLNFSFKIKTRSIIKKKPV